MVHVWVFQSISNTMGKFGKTIKWVKPGKLVPIFFLWYEWFFPLDSHLVAYFIIWEMDGFLHEFPIARENVTKPSGKPGKLWYSYFSHSMGAFLQPDSHPVIYFITWEMLKFPHEFPIALENAVKSIELREPGKLVPILSPKCGYFFSSMNEWLASNCFFASQY